MRRLSLLIIVPVVILSACETTETPPQDTASSSSLSSFVSSSISATATSSKKPAVIATSSTSKNVPSAALPKIESITAGVARDDIGNIVKPMTGFRTTDRYLAFNVVLTNVTKPTMVTAYWILEGDDSYFTMQEVTVTETESNALFHIEKESDWPAANYTMRVEVGDANGFEVDVFQYRIGG